MSETEESPIVVVRRVGWIVVLAVGVAMAGLTNFVLPDDHGALDTLYLASLAFSSVAIVVGSVVWNSPRAVTQGWLVIAVGVAMYLGGESLWIWYARTGRDPFPSAADGLFLVGVLLLIAGTARLVSARRIVRDRAVQLDTLIVAVSVGAVLWVLAIEPYALDPEVPLLEQVVSGIYPLLDVLLVATIARLVLAGGRIPIGFVLLLAGVALWTFTDIAYYQLELTTGYVEWGWLDFLYMIAFAVTGASALHPAAPRVADLPEKPASLGRSRAVLLGLFAMLPLSLVALSSLFDREVDPILLSTVTVVLIGLVVARTWSLMSVHREIGELRSRARFTALIDNSSDAIVIVSDEQRIDYVSPALANVWGWGDGRLVGRPLSKLVESSSLPALRRWIDAMDGGRVDDPLEVDWFDGDGELRRVSMVASDLRDDDEIAGIVITARDVSHRVEFEERLRHDAAHDSLTGLFNRKTFAEVIEEQRGHGISAVAFIDLDDFKDVNDVLGHDVGDGVLVQVSRRLEGLLRAGDVLARLGGDEFGVLFTGDEESAGAVAERLVDAGGAIEVGAHAIEVSLSVGFCVLGDEVDGADALRRADLAMYEAKRNGKGRVAQFSKRLLDEVEERLDTRSRLRSALANGEMHLVYQNIVRISDGVVAAREALLRWTLEGRAVAPDEFIPVAEDTGDIVEIGRWVLERACRDATDWAEHDGAPPIVSVNVSPVQLDTDYFAVVADVLDETGLDPDRLQLELTESVIAQEAAAVAFQRLSRLGVRLAIDDFGTGYCSLAYLQRFVVDAIKIDRQLVDGCHHDTRLLSGIAGLISSVGAVAVAEGVEDSLDRDALDDLGVSMGQGFLWHRPQRFDERACDTLPAVSSAPEA